MNGLRERLLIRRLRQRDERAFQEVVRLYQHKVFNLLVRMLGNHAEAEDVAQEVFVTVFKAIDGFRGESKFSTWLYRIATNLCKNRMKYLGRRAYHTTTELDDAIEGALPDLPSDPLVHTTAGPEQALAGRQIGAIVQAAIAKLDDEHRMLVVLRDLEDLSYEEIVAITGLAEGTVKSRLHRARMALKAYLAKEVG